ncbi:MAG TPA: nuclear transport factor 2 family protein [Stellaceae bacterium]
MDKLIGALAALLLLGPAAEAADEQRETNKQTVIAFYEAAINHKDFAAAEKYLGSRYTQHNPNAADGPQGLKKFLDFLRDKYPAAHSEIRQVFADGDYVILHVHAVREPNTAGSAIVDIFKLEDGKIVEHWDVIQPIPDKAANGNGMF